MKKINLILFAFSLFNISFGQAFLDSLDLPNEDYEVYMYQNGGLELDLPSVGEDQVWNYNDLWVNNPDSTAELMLTSSTNYASDFPNSDLANESFLSVLLNDQNLKNIGITGGLSFLTKKKTGLMLNGILFETGDVNTNYVLNLKDSLSIIPLSLAYGDTKIEEDSGGFPFSFLGNVSFTIKQTLTGVGAGKLITPADTLDETMLVKRVLSIGVSGLLIDETITVEEYTWYQKDSLNPVVMRMNSDDQNFDEMNYVEFISLNRIDTSFIEVPPVWEIPEDTVGAIFSQHSQETNAYPNPVNKELHFKKTIRKVSVFDINQNIIYADYKRTKSIDFSTFTEGVYFLKYEDEEGNLISEKIIKY